MAERFFAVVTASVDERTCAALEFGKVLERLQSLATYPPTAERIAALRPSADAATVAGWQDETAEALALKGAGVDVYLQHLVDIESLIRRAEVGGVLEEGELLAVAATIAASRQLRRAILGSHVDAPLTKERVRRLPDLHAVEAAIVSRINEDGQLRDEASPTLRSIRERLRSGQSRLRSLLEDWVRRAAAQGALQEATFTMRNGRYVLPVRHDRRDAVPGIVHDRSGSGQTLFIEPAPLVELGNRLRELEAEEREERLRILTQLTRSVGMRAADLRFHRDTLIDLDFAAAKARLALRYHGIRPEVAPDGDLELRGARHPLLEEERLAGKISAVVPLDLSCPRSTRVVLITGPNTGGKTVALKTIGLLALMHQAGLHVPVVAGTRLPIYRRIFADIGDEQSIEQSLSTFSAHLAHIISILREADEASLVLLDELGAGTDPQEGAALAMAILDELYVRRAMTIATTHYGQLKSYAHVREGMVNACVEFDVASLAPTYRLVMGRPGRSNALAIAARLGVPPRLLAAARNYLGAEKVHFEDLLADIEYQQRKSALARQEAESAQREAERLRAELEAAKRELADERDALLRAARREAQEIVRQARREAEEWIRRFRQAGAEQWVEEARRARQRLQAALAELDGSDDTQETTDAMEEDTFQRGEVEQLAPGDRVWVPSLGQEGEVIDISLARGEATVQIGPMRTVVAVDELRAVAGSAARGAKGSGDKKGRTEPGVSAFFDAKAAESTPRELHVRGMTVDEALMALEKFLDNARLAGLDEVRIVHGKGTGTLRRAVLQYLSEQPFVVDYRLAPPNEGGHGVTIVEMA